MKKHLCTPCEHGILEIEIRCNDPFGNGYESFAVTGSVWIPHRGRKSSYDDYRTFGGKTHSLLCCGCIHDKILEAMPELKPLVALHLSDGDGAPMHAVENGFFHLQGVRGEAAYGHTCTLETFAEYMRVTLPEAETARDTLRTKEEFSAWVDTLRPRWKAEADSGKALIESLPDA